MSFPSDTSFQSRWDLPDEYLQHQARRLVGFQRRFEQLSGHLRLLSDHDGLQAWATKHHGKDQLLTSVLADRYPLAIFHGDVGNGKTVTAESSADAVCRMLGVEGILLKLSTGVRGVGHVGEMSSLINDAFSEAIDLAGKRRFVAIIIDEGDALAFNRAAERAHHEDRVGVNTLIQNIDNSRRLKGRLLIFICTNRFAVIDPAILRRASLIEEFPRPDQDERHELLTASLKGVDGADTAITELVRVTGPRDGRPGFTFSDIQTRLIPEAVIMAFPDRELRAEDLLAVAADMQPTPEIREQNE